MAARVYFCRIGDWTDLEHVASRLSTLLEKAPILNALKTDDLVGIKLTFGEAGNRGHAPAPLIRRLVEIIRNRRGIPFLTETNTLYNGRRKNSVDHLEVAREHGFTHETVGAPIILSDGILGREHYDVEIQGKHTRTAHLAPSVRDMDFLVGVAHLTGHMVEGFGGAVKNIGMGLASRAGKLDQHSSVSPSVKQQICNACLACFRACPAGAISETPTAVTIDPEACIGCAECISVCPEGAIQIDWSRETAQVQEATAEYGLAVVRALRHGVAFINLLNHITKQCDCVGRTDEILAPDIGILGATDPVAIDQASIDLTCEAAGRDVFKEAWPRIDALVQIRHGETLGLGSRRYEIVEV
ncbi:MAG: DUF362 domain-containing protein [Candidatus Eisenbacteria sp.]|nr:DUF362 domain-containing protein [Candidatus Eisenbacteria bacterium]